jgi:hypothetical protein
MDFNKFIKLAKKTHRRDTRLAFWGLLIRKYIDAIVINNEQAIDIAEDTAVA